MGKARRSNPNLRTSVLLRWRVVDLIKIALLCVVILLLSWNISMVSHVAQKTSTSAHEGAAHLLRTNEMPRATTAAPVAQALAQEDTEDSTPATGAMLDPVRSAKKAATKDTPAAPKKASDPLLERPWFLDPNTYKRSSGCDFSEAVRLFRPEQLELNCANIDQLQLGEYLGEGFWRKVYKANWKGREVAVKIVKEKLMNRSDIITRHVEEVAAMFPVRNAPNIVSLIGWCNTTVVVDFVPNPLDELLYDSKEPISVRRSLELARDAARGLAQFHSGAGGPFAHTDIQSRQFLIHADGKLLLNDFNRVKYTGRRNIAGASGSDKCTFHTPVAKGKWRSPEEYKLMPLNEKLDVYSLSLVLWSIASRVKPFENRTREQVYERVPKGARPPIEAMSSYPKAMQDLIVRCWDAHPKRRPSANLLAHEIDKILSDYDEE